MQDHQGRAQERKATEGLVWQHEKMNNHDYVRTDWHGGKPQVQVNRLNGFFLYTDAKTSSCGIQNADNKDPEQFPHTIKKT